MSPPCRADYSAPQNPYQHEIFHSNYPPLVFNTDGQSIPPIPLENNDLIWVDNMSTFTAMLNDLKQANEIAIDLEHHDYRSYYGFVCLMQISTRKQDWIVDTLELREELIALNEVFTDPSVVKVFSHRGLAHERYCMEQHQTLNGCSEILGYILSVYLIRTPPPSLYNSRQNPLLFSS
jgi:hypothetical protein